jgi:pyruvate kinase
MPHMPGTLPQHLRRTRIVATLGPACEDRSILKELILAGMDVARLNLSHGTIPEHIQRIEMVRSLEQETGRRVGILADLCGPKIRIGKFESEPVTLVMGQSFTLTTREMTGSVEGVSCTYANLPKDVKPGHIVFLSDGLIQLEVQRVEGQDVHCTVRVPGTLSSGKGLNLPGTQLSTPSLTAKDLKDLEGILQADIDFVALSFVRGPEDITGLRDIIRNLGKEVPIIAKIEKPESVERLDEILAVTNVIMVARGDLGVETSVEAMPVLQKHILAKARMYGVPAITATQMLESMTTNPRPTRAEATDVANAVLDGTDAVMLSGETASGKYPVSAVETMARIIQMTETGIGSASPDVHLEDGPGGIEGVTAKATAQVAGELGAKAVCVYTRTGATAKVIAKYRPPVPIVALTPDERVARRLKLIWGTYPLHHPHSEDMESMVQALREQVVPMGLLKEDDLVCLVSGWPREAHGFINTLSIIHLSDYPGR